MFNYFNFSVLAFLILISLKLQSFALFRLFLVWESKPV